MNTEYRESSLGCFLRNIFLTLGPPDRLRPVTGPPSVTSHWSRWGFRGVRGRGRFPSPHKAPLPWKRLPCLHLFPVSCQWANFSPKTLESPLAPRRSNQSILKAINPGCSLEGLMLKLKLQYFGHLMRRADSFEKTLMLGKIEGRRRDHRG